MEAAACYIGETKNPDRDAKIAMNLEGAYGVFIYTLIPIAFVIVIGTKALGNVSLADPKTIFVSFAAKVFGSGPEQPARVADRDHADPRADPLGAQRHHRHSPVAPSDVNGRPVPEVLPAGQPPRCAGPRDGLQRRLLDHRRVLRRRRPDLHVLERRLPRLVRPGARRLLPAAQGPAEREAAVQAAGVDEVPGARARRLLHVHLLLRRDHLRELRMQRRRSQDAPVLLHRLRPCSPRTSRSTGGASATT